jgi:hypothetical protein
MTASCRQRVLAAYEKAFREFLEQQDPEGEPAEREALVASSTRNTAEWLTEDDACRMLAMGFEQNMGEAIELLLVQGESWQSVLRRFSRRLN